MQKQQSWLWPKKSFPTRRSRYFYERDALRQSQNEVTQSSLVTSKGSFTENNKVEGDVMNPIEKPSNASAKVADKVAAVWEKAERETENLEARSAYLETALKECLRQLRQTRDDQDMKELAWESTKSELEERVCGLQAQLEASKTKVRVSHNSNKLKALEDENTILKQELVALSKELEIATVEHNLGAKASETAKEIQLESINRVVNLKGECQRRQSIVRKLRPDSFGCMDCGDRMNVEDIDAPYSGTLPMALVSKLNWVDQKPMHKGVGPWSLELNMMDDFLETEADLLSQRIKELEKKLEKTESEKFEAIGALERMTRRVEELQKEVHDVNKAKNTIESQLMAMEGEASTASANANLLKEEIVKERSLSAELRAECQKLKNEVTKKGQETNEANDEPKVKQEGVTTKLVECQRTIASLGRQLKSLATLDDFLVETKDLPGLDNGQLVSKDNNDVSKAVGGLDHGRKSRDKGSCSVRYGNIEGMQRISTFSLMDSGAKASKRRNGIGNIFARGKNTKGSG